ncbi:uncharacterized protein J7T54_006400 [Emericellopsis cladophorae]|uniref:Uncharacterized protein n=1 Tax=Emericellopsis cladophorae TaxID=2686198 RepID=A0A9Q0BH43_9HYPO|nr:uncharacterized protein J7T54_006400 [Emericellopsis cladophorae]KAI6784355.1 hypothetical protein J7T54_006400 [Emericellopsis cladophorae]
MKAGIVVLLVAAAAAHVIPHDASSSIPPDLALARRTPKTSHALDGSHGKCIAAIADAEDASRQTKPHETREKRSPEEPLHLEINPPFRYHIPETPEKKHARLEGQLVKVAKHLLDDPVEGDDPADYIHPELKEKWIEYVEDAEKKNPPKTPEVEPPTKPSHTSPSESSSDEQSKEVEPTGEDGGSDEVGPQEPDIQPAEELQEPEVQSVEQFIAEDETDKGDPHEPEKPSDKQVQHAEASASEEAKPNKKEKVPKEVKKAHKTAKPSKGRKGPKHGGKKGASDNMGKGMGKGSDAGSAISRMGVPAAAVLGAASVVPEGLAAASGPGTAAVGGEALARAKVPGTESLGEALNLGGVGNPADAVIDTESLGNTDSLATSEALAGTDVPGKGPENLPNTGLDLATPDAETVGAESSPATKGHSAIGTGSKILGAAALAGGVASKIAEGVVKLSNPLPVPPANGTKKQDEVQAEMELGPSTLYEGGQDEDQDEENREPDDRDDVDKDLEEADQDENSQDEGNAEGAIKKDMDNVVDFFGRAAKRLLDILRKLRALQMESKAANKQDKENEEKQKAIDDAQGQKDHEDQETSQKQKVKEKAQKKKDKVSAQKQKDKSKAQKKKDKQHAQKQKDKASAPKQEDKETSQKHKVKETPPEHRVEETPQEQKGEGNVPKGAENLRIQKIEANAQRLAELRHGAGERLKVTAFGKELDRIGFGAPGNEVMSGMAKQVLDVASGESEMTGKQGSPYTVNGVQIDPNWKEKHMELFAAGQACVDFEHFRLLELVEADELYQAVKGKPSGYF